MRDGAASESAVRWLPIPTNEAEVRRIARDECERVFAEYEQCHREAMRELSDEMKSILRESGAC